MSRRLRLKAKYQKSKGASSWTLKEAVVIRLWAAVWQVFLRWTPKCMNRLRLLSLRTFGAKVHGRPFVFSSARIYAPFNLELHDRSCIGPNVDVYNLGRVILREEATISQDTMLCGGTHDLCSPRLPLLVGDIDIGRNAFIGVRAMVLPGIAIGEGGVVGAGSVVTRDVDAWAVVGGNPARQIGKREMRND